MDIIVKMTCEKGHRERVMLWGVELDEEGQLQFAACDHWHHCMVCEGKGLDSLRSEESQMFECEQLQKAMHHSAHANRHFCQYCAQLGR